jgi:hypothetical protein
MHEDRIKENNFSLIFRFLDDQVLAFIKIIAPHLNGIDIHLVIRNLDAQKRGFTNRLLKIFREEKSPNTFISMYTNIGNIQFLPDMDNKMHQLELTVDEDTDIDVGIPLLMKMLATPRPDGQQRVIWLFFCDEVVFDNETPMKMLDTIKQVELFSVIILIKT